MDEPTGWLGLPVGSWADWASTAANLAVVITAFVVVLVQHKLEAHRRRIDQRKLRVACWEVVDQAKALVKQTAGHLSVVAHGLTPDRGPADELAVMDTVLLDFLDRKPDDPRLVSLIAGMRKSVEVANWALTTGIKTVNDFKAAAAPGTPFPDTDGRTTMDNLANALQVEITRMEGRISIHFQERPKAER